MLRIIAGACRGVVLNAPSGRETRPTSARAREALFNLLRHGAAARPLEGAHVADIFAGTGALGLEALSRGAASAALVEKAPAACAAIRANIARCRAGGTARLVMADATRPRRAAKPFDILFVDPPYRGGLVEKSLTALIRAGWAGADSLVIVQQDPRDPVLPSGGWRILENRCHGAARLLFLTPEDPENRENPAADGGTALPSAPESRI